MNRGEKKIVIGGVVVTALVTGGFTLSQGPLGPVDDSYQSPLEQVVMSEQSEIVNTSSETVKEDNQVEQLEEIQQDIKEETTQDEKENIEEDNLDKEENLVQEEISKASTYDINKAYKKGEVVTYNGIDYKAKWWTKGESPDNYVDWEEVAVINEDGSENYAKGKHYVKGSIVVYEGNKYQAKWWTESTPGSNDSWIYIN